LFILLIEILSNFGKNFVRMKLHIVGGFLGSGKTAAINNAAKRLASGGIKVGVITNDLDKYPEDKCLVYDNYSPSEEVINGSFSSNLDNLSDKIVRLHQNDQPEYIFAESVGSCTDLVATVLKPLMVFNSDIFESLTLSIFVDARMLLSYLKGDKLVYGKDVLYIFEKQIEEADLLVINKIDLLMDADFPELKRLVDNNLNGKYIISQDSFNPQNLENWLDTLASLPSRKRSSLIIDYHSYGKGETDLTWLEEEYTFSSSNNDAGEFVFRFIDNILIGIDQQQLPIGHIKFRLMQGEQVQNMSFTAFDNDDWKNKFVPIPSNLAKLILNARLETRNDILLTIIKNSISSDSFSGIKISKKISTSKQSGVPNPTNFISKEVRCCEECICLKKLIERNAIRIADGSAVALTELEDEKFECLGLCGECGEGDGCCC